MLPRWRKHQSLFYRLHPEYLPAESIELKYTLGLGGITVWAGLVAVFTGVLLTFYYSPTPETAYDSVTLIQDLVYYGSLVRAMHYWSAQLMLVAATLHMFRVLFTGAFAPPRRVNWVVGVMLLALILLWSFSGYILRWDVDTVWALGVGMNLVRATPLLGPWLYRLLAGSEHPPAGAALLRFYDWHIIGLTLVTLFGVVYHLFRLRVDGGISRARQRYHRVEDLPYPPSQVRQKGRRVMVHKNWLFWREGVAALVTLSGLLLLSALAPAPLGLPPQASAEVLKIEAPWFFRWVQWLLRYLPPVWAGVLLPAGLLLGLMALPWLVAKPRTGHWFHPAQRGVALLVSLLALALLILILWETWL